MSSRAAGQVRYGRAIRWPLLLISALVMLNSCESATDIGLDMQVADSAGHFYVDTFTVRTSTVLLDSLPTSSSSYLMMGRYVDAQLGPVTARSFAQLGLSAPFVLTTTAVYDSLVLVLAVDSYRYGDTTRTQHVAVHRLSEGFATAKTYYTNSTALAYETTPLATRAFRARPGLTSLRIRLPDALGQELLTLGRNRQLSTVEELRYYMPGLALVPSATDDAALLRFLATSDTQLLHFYSHESANPATVIDQTFPVDGQHFYQLQDDRQNTQLASLTATRQALPSSSTAEETFIQNGTGLYTKVEIPYLLDLPNLGGTSLLVSARLEMQLVNGTVTRYLPPPAALAVYQASAANRLTAVLTAADGTTALTMPYTVAQANNGLDQGTYAADLTPYLRNVLTRTLPNNGLLLLPTTADTPERVGLGSQRNATNPLKLKIYYTRVQ